MDYNIYLHSTISENDDPTTPWKSRDSSEMTGFQTRVSEAVQQAKETPSMIAGAVRSVGTAIKSHPAVSAALALFVILDKATDVASQFVATETGDYAFRIRYDNFKSTFHAVTHPVSSTFNMIRQEQQWRLTTQRNEINRSMFGDVAFNNGKFYGV